MKKVVITVISVTFLIFIVFFILGSVFTDKFVNEEISKIKNSAASTKSIFEIDSLSSCPALLKKYFNYSINDSNSRPTYLKLDINGKLKTAENSNWQDVTAEQYYSISTPAYIWNAQLKMNEFVFARAIETYIKGTGNILVKLFSSLKISDATGDPVDQSCLTRYLCESVFFPNALLPGENLEWQFAEQGKLKAILKYGALKVEADFYFNSNGQVTKIETMDRYRTTASGYERTLFSVTFSDYKSFNNYIIPTSFKTNWHTKKGKFTFGEFNITGAQYN